MTSDGTTYEISAAESATRPAPRAFVAVVGGQGPTVVSLPAEVDVSVGRSSSSGIQIDDKAVSRLHATLRWDGGDRVLLTDHGSRNGTLVAGKRVTGAMTLERGAEIVIAGRELVIGITGTLRRGGEPEPEVGAAPDVVAESPAMLSVLAMTERAARSEATVFIVGETGSGKEVIAKRIHALSSRRARPFVAINCGAIPENLAEAMLFGHERGAFTGAETMKEGVFEAADGGVLFLDEVGELSPRTQGRLLRVLEDRTITRVGGTKPIKVDVRLVAATHRDLAVRAEKGTFRQDLLYRLDVLRLFVPPLRQHPEDVIPLAEHFLRTLGGGRFGLSPEARKALTAHSFPGNVRELRNMIERATAIAEDPILTATDLVLVDAKSPDNAQAALHEHRDEAEREAIVRALTAADGNQTRAAKALGVSRRTLIYKLEKHGLKAPPKKRS